MHGSHTYTMSIIETIRQALHKQQKTEQDFCEKFGISALEDLPLQSISEVAAFFQTTEQRLITGNFLHRPFPKNIKLLILDVDGVMTDSGMYYSENGDMLKKFNAKDGMGILQLTKTGFQVGVISSGFKGELVKQRADLLKIQHFYLGREPKLEILKKWCSDLDIDLKDVAMIGDDVNDLAVMRTIGFSACPSDAARRVLQEVDCVLSKKGGEGCIREFIEDVMGVEVGYIS